MPHLCRGLIHTATRCWGRQWSPLSLTSTWDFWTKVTKRLQNPTSKTRLWHRVDTCPKWVMPHDGHFWRERHLLLRLYLRWLWECEARWRGGPSAIFCNLLSGHNRHVSRWLKVSEAQAAWFSPIMFFFLKCFGVNRFFLTDFWIQLVVQAQHHLGSFFETRNWFNSQGINPQILGQINNNNNKTRLRRVISSIILTLVDNITTRRTLKKFAHFESILIVLN